MQLKQAHEILARLQSEQRALNVRMTAMQSDNEGL